MSKKLFLLYARFIGFCINTISFLSPKLATQIAHRYFSRPRKGKLTEKSFPKIFESAQHETINHNEENIQIYVWKGNETVLFLVHGWESNSFRWKKMMSKLVESGSTIVAIDGPAQGFSSGKEFTVLKYAEFIDVVAKKYKPNYIMGHSMGGQTSLYYQYIYQNPILEKIVLLGAPSDFEIIFKNFTSLLNLNNRVIKALDDKYTLFVGQNLSLFSSKEFVKYIDVKGLIVHDTEDKIVLFKEAKKIAQTWKEVEFIETSGLGHKLHDEDLYEKIYNFIFR